VMGLTKLPCLGLMAGLPRRSSKSEGGASANTPDFLENRG